MSKIKSVTLILAATAELLNKEGPLEVRPSVIAAMSGVSQSLIHYHFPETTYLIAAAVINLYEAHVAESREVLAKDGSRELVHREWYLLQKQWAIRNPGAAAVILGSTAFKLVRNEKWKTLERIMIDGLVPNIMNRNTDLSITEATTAARIEMILSLLPVVTDVKIFQAYSENLKT